MFCFCHQTDLTWDLAEHSAWPAPSPCQHTDQLGEADHLEHLVHLDLVTWHLPSCASEQQWRRWEAFLPTERRHHQEPWRLEAFLDLEVDLLELKGSQLADLQLLKLPAFAIIC